MPTASGRLIANQARLLAASDVNWDFYFREPTRLELAHQGITRHRRRSRLEHLLESRPREHPGDGRRLAPCARSRNRRHTQRQARQRARVRHGTAGREEAHAGGAASDNEITASTDLAFQVAVMNSGNFRETNVGVTLTIQKSPKSIVKRMKIDVINTGQTKTVTFTNIDINGLFGLPTTVKVDVQPVPGETTVSNNTAEYKVIFSLGG